LELSEFRIGMNFYIHQARFRCTDIGSKVVFGIQLTPQVGSGKIEEMPNVNGLRRLTEGDDEAAGWFNGPPYAVTEIVFDEDDIQRCTPNPVQVVW